MKLGIISGIHEDIVRLREALSEIKARDCDEGVCLGDIVGFSPQYYGYPDTRDAHGAIELVRENCKYAVVGNHDLFAIQRLPQDRILFSYPADWYQKTLEERKQKSKGAIWVYEDESPTSLSEQDRAYLDSLPEFLTLPFGGHKILISHYAYPNLTGSAVEFDPAKDNSIQQHFAFMQQNGCDVGILAHDLQGGVRFFAKGKIEERPFGLYADSELPVAFNGPWVANGTEPNGFLIFDTESMRIEVVPLNSSPVEK